MYIPETLKTIIGNRPYEIDDMGKSSSHVLLFDDMVLKIERQSEESDNEHQMLKWLGDKLPVPEILHASHNNGFNYLLMRRVAGHTANANSILENPKHLTILLAQGLKLLWDVDRSNCPYTNNLDNKLRLAEINVVNNLCDIEDVEPGTYGPGGFESPAHLLHWLKENRPQEELIFSHGDYCLPNIFINHNQINGFIDLGRSGLADKYQDIALCYRCLLHHYDEAHGGKAYDDYTPMMLFDVLNIEPDWDKIKYYTLLDELF